MSGKPKPRHSVTQPRDQSIKLISLTHGQNAIVDAGDYDWLNKWYWQAHWDAKMHSFYAMRTGPRPERKCISMHNLILGHRADHINHNTLDNRRVNLRKATHRQNMRNKRRYRSNTTGYVGVVYCARLGKFAARITVNKNRIHLGLYTSAKEAAYARDQAAKKLHGKFAALNFPSHLDSSKSAALFPAP